MLIDIGNSKKSQGKNRGFRGIGRLAGLGYCDTLTFSTSAANESKKTVVSFDAKKLKDLLIPGKGVEESIYDVLNAVISTKQEPEKEKSHYFEVCLQGISLKSTLMEKEVVRNYLIQNAPLPFNPTFKWGEEINKKLSMEGWRVPVYNIYLTMNMDTTAKWFEDVLGWYSNIVERDVDGNGCYGVVFDMLPEVELVHLAPFTGFQMFC